MGLLDYIVNFGYDYSPLKDLSPEEQEQTKQNAYKNLGFNSSSDSIGASVFNNSINALLNAYQTSAIKAEKESVADARKWAEEQADLAWQRSESSAQKQMDFQKAQNDLAWQRSESSAQKQMDFQREIQQLSMDFNERMSSTAYQRVVQDLRKAGLNPILAISNGSASSPSVGVLSGASASASAMSGASASASMPTSVKGDYSSAKNADTKVELYDIFSGSLTSALKSLLNS